MAIKQKYTRKNKRQNRRKTRKNKRTSRKSKLRGGNVPTGTHPVGSHYWKLANPSVHVNLGPTPWRFTR